MYTIKLFQTHFPKVLSVVLLICAANSKVVLAASEMPDELREEFAYSLGVQAYVYAYPLVHTNKFRWIWHSKDSPMYRGPANQLNHNRVLMNAETTVAATPNNDTLYTLAFLDLSEAPLIIEVPAIKDRYYTIQLADMYATNFASFGSRTGAAAGKYLMVPPGWQGEVPEGIEKVYESTTPWTMFLLRILVDGKADIPAVNALQDQFRLLTVDGKPSPAYAGKIPDLVDPANPADAWRVINRELASNPPIPAHESYLSQFSNIGIGIDLPIKLSDLDAETSKGLSRAAETAHQIVTAQAADISSVNLNHWGYPKQDIGRYGSDFAYRAAVTLMGLMANQPEEAVYLSSYTDVEGQALDGTKHYRMHFPADNLPPANAFWSATMYDSATYAFSGNKLNRFSIGDRTERLKYNQDGSLDIFIGPTVLDEGEISNWLPTPDGPFYMFLRVYNPETSVIEQTWEPPGVITR
ncbi:MAG: DUF1254 domain-containing protein [Pseudomonadales bacterium]